MGSWKELGLDKVRCGKEYALGDSFEVSQSKLIDIVTKHYAEGQEKVTLLERLAIDKYSSSGYRILNEFLRENDRRKTYLDVEKKALTKYSKLLTRALENIGTNQYSNYFLLYETLYRGVDRDTKYIYGNALKVGDKITENSFLSTSELKEEAGKHTDRFMNSTLYIIKNCYGVPIYKFACDTYQEEREVLLLPGTEFLVTNVSKDPNRENITVRPTNAKQSGGDCPKSKQQGSTATQNSSPSQSHDKTSSGSSRSSANNANATDEEGFTTTQIALIVAAGIAILAVILGIVYCCLCRGKLLGGAQNPYDRHRTNHHPSEHPLSRFRRVQRHHSKR